MRYLALIVLFLLIPFWSGCIAFYNHSQYHVKVIDVEQHKPVEDAIVSVSYSYMLVLNAPKPTLAMTNPNGLAELKVANTSFPRRLNISAEGYSTIRGLSFQHNLNVPEEFKTQNENEVIVPIYRKPEPLIEIIIPEGYRGPIALELIPTDKLTHDKHSKTNYSHKIMPNGYVTVHVPPFDNYFDVDKISARYENGNSVITFRHYHDLVSFSLIQCDKSKYLFSIGTIKEEHDLECSLYPESKDGIKNGPFSRDLFNSYFKE